MYIAKTCNYRLSVFLNSINNNSGNSDKLRNIIDEIDNITLVTVFCHGVNVLKVDVIELTASNI